MANKTVHLPMLGGHAAQGRLVGRPSAHRARPLGLHRLRDVPRVRGRRPTSGGRTSRPSTRRSSTFVGEGLGPRLLHAGDAHPARARVVPPHLLLLPQGLLPGVRDGTRRRARSASATPHRYNGETKLLLFQNLHRYAMYVAVLFLVILWKDAVLARLRLEGRRARRRRHARDAHQLRAPQRATRSAATRFRHLVGGGVNSYSKAAARQAAPPALEARDACSTSATCRFAWASLFCVALTDLYIRMVATGAITDVEALLSMAETKFETHEHDVLVIGAGGAGLRAAIEASAEGAQRRARLQVAPRQGAHGHGRGGRRRRARERRAEGQLEGPLPRHDEGRPLPEPVAHGAAPRDGSARPGEGARGVGRALRPHGRRAHPPAQLRRSQVPAPRARRRPHRASR